MSDVWTRIAIGAAISVGMHFVFTELLELLPPAEAAGSSPPVEIRVVEPPKQPEALPDPEPEPPKPDPEPPKPEPQKKPLEPHPPVPQPPTVVHDVAPVDTPPTDHAVVSDSTTKPVYGVTMESTSQGGNGPAVHVGNTLSPGAGSAVGPAKDAVKPLAPPVAAYEVTKLPLPQGRCAGKYTDEARTAGIEGVVVLDLIVDEHGRAREITVVQGLEHGLTQAAIAALTACTFTPGEKSGQAVPVRVRGFKIRFVMSDSP